MQRFRRTRQRRERQCGFLRHKCWRRLPVVTHDAESCMQAAQKQSAVRATTHRWKTLQVSFDQILVARRHDAAMFAMSAHRLFDGEKLLGHAWPFPLAAKSCR